MKNDNEVFLFVPIYGIYQGYVNYKKTGEVSTNIFVYMTSALYQGASIAFCAICIEKLI